MMAMMMMIRTLHIYIRFVINGDKPHNHSRVDFRQNVSQFGGYSIEVLEKHLAVFDVHMCLA